jgi:hypothetical protein
MGHYPYSTTQGITSHKTMNSPFMMSYQNKSYCVNLAHKYYEPRWTNRTLNSAPVRVNPYIRAPSTLETQLQVYYLWFVLQM